MFGGLFYQVACSSVACRHTFAAETEVVEYMSQMQQSVRCAAATTHTIILNKRSSLTSLPLGSCDRAGGGVKRSWVALGHST